MHVRTRVLAIEPDPRRARTLKNLLRAEDAAALAIVTSVDAALGTLAGALPELILTSTFLAPADERRLIDRLNDLPDARHVQVIALPHLADAEAPTTTSTSRARLTLLRRRASAGPAPADAHALREQLEQYLREPRIHRDERVPSPEPAVAAAAPHAAADETTTTIATRGAARPAPGRAPGKDRRVARRQRREDLTWLWSVKLPWGSEVRVVDMSTTGVLMETTSKLPTGSTVELKLLGRDTNVTVPARAVRSEIAGVDALGVTYRIAAAFANEVDVAGLQRANRGASLRPRTISDMLSRVMADVERCPGPAALRKKFLNELQELVPARDIQLRHSPAPLAHDASVYFSVPGKSRMVLQVTFEENYEPSEVEFRFLQAAANAAAVILQFAELEMPDEFVPAGRVRASEAVVA